MIHSGIITLDKEYDNQDHLPMYHFHHGIEMMYISIKYEHDSLYALLRNHGQLLPQIELYNGTFPSSLTSDFVYFALSSCPFQPPNTLSNWYKEKQMIDVKLMDSYTTTMVSRIPTRVTVISTETIFILEIVFIFLCIYNLFSSYPYPLVIHDTLQRHHHCSGYLYLVWKTSMIPSYFFWLC